MKKKFLHAITCIMLTGALLAGCTKDKDPDQDRPDEPVTPTQTTETTTAEDTGTDDPEEPDHTGKKIALALPDETMDHWSSDGDNMKKSLEALGYRVEIQYAQNRPKQQAGQVMDFVEQGADCIVIAPVSSKKLKKAQAAAQKAGIPVIAYDRLLMDTDAVSFYVTFDHKGMGNKIGQAVVEQAGLDDLEDGEYKTIEFFMGPQGEKESLYIYQGLMEVLRPYLDNGMLVCNTGRTSFEDTAIADWSPERAKNWCENYLEGYYNQEDLDICVTASDQFAYGCKQSFLAAGYTEDNWPVISGIGCEIQACKNILEGTQSFSICKDSRMLAAECAKVVDALMNGMEPDVNNAQLYDNNKMIVPAHMCSTLVIDAENLMEVLVDGGYYTERQIQGAK